MRHLFASQGGRLVAATLIVAMLGLAACGDLTSSLPDRPSPVPTLARLPSVTPMTPSPTRPPTHTPLAATTPTAAPLIATVAVAANVRAGPGLDFAIVGGLDAGVTVSLLRRREGWFEIAGPGGVAGWMFGQVLTIDPATEAEVPTGAP